MPNVIRQGATYDFKFDLSGESESAFTSVYAVMQYPGDTPAISGSLTYTDDSWQGTLTSAQTAALSVGQWFIHLRASDSDEDLREPLKLYIAKGWI